MLNDTEGAHDVAPNNEEHHAKENCPHHVDIALIEKRLSDMERDLIGNGKPGRLDRIETSLENLKNQVSKVVIIAAMIAGATGAGGAKLASVLLGAPADDPPRMVANPNAGH